MDNALRHRVNAARVALRGQFEFFQNQLGKVASEWKADDTRVTFADFAVSENVLRALRSSFPKDVAFSEESDLCDEAMPLNAKYVWVLDPIDGTNNYALGMRTCAISLGLLKSGQPYYGFIYDGSSGELIEGGPGEPLLVNGRRWIVPQRPLDPMSSIVALHFPLSNSRCEDFRDLLSSFRVRCLGSCALQLAYTAMGKLDGFIDEKVKVWDVAGGLALLAAGKRSYRFLGSDPFPLRFADPNSPSLRICGGSEAFMEVVDNWLGADAQQSQS